MATDSAKSRGKTALEPGYSLMAWMRLSQSGVDLTSGVGAVDMDEGEETWKEWTTAEVMEHNTPEDAWMVLHGKVYNVTPYLRYHPGGVDTLLEAAGGDGTALFDKYHPWVNAVGILGACCLGRLAKTSVAVASSSAAPEVEQPTPEDEAQHTMSVSWDEAGIQAHDAERGIMFGTMKCDQPETPYLYLDEDNPCGEVAAIHPKYLSTHVPSEEQTGGPGPHPMRVADLQDALGLVMTDDSGLASFSRPKWAHADEFGAQRQALYSGEARLAALSAGLPDGWSVFMSRSEPAEPFYHHHETNTTVWERPVAT